MEPGGLGAFNTGRFFGGHIRAFLNSILSIIGSSSLTDLEWATISDIATQSYTLEVYEALLSVVDARETVSNTRDRLRYYFLALNVDVPESDTAKSNILIGGDLC